MWKVGRWEGKREKVGSIISDLCVLENHKNYFLNKFFKSATIVESN